VKIPRIFQNQPLKVDDYVELALDPSHRLISVLRLKEGNPLVLFNGDGYEYISIIHTLKRNKVGIKISEKIAKNVESFLEIHLGQVISKGEKMDFVIQKATELGVNKITPLFSERGIVRITDERVEKKIQHFQKIAIHAAEQCGRTIIPTIESPTALTEWVFKRSENTRLILEPTAANPLTNIKLVSPIAILIGPEGGFTDEEINYAIQYEFKPLKLGPRILRTETATLAAIAAIQCTAGDLGI